MNKSEKRSFGLFIVAALLVGTVIGFFAMQTVRNWQHQEKITAKP